MIYLITLGYTPNKMFEQTAKRLCESLSGKHEIERIFVAKPYPINLEENYEANLRTCRKYGYKAILRDQDLGAAADFNETLFRLKPGKLGDDDFIFVYDHDIYPIQDGWDDAMISVMQADPKVDWVCMWNCASDNEFGARGGIPVTIAGHRCMQAITPMMAMTSLIRGSFLNYTGGLIQPCNYYGGVELAMWPKIVSRGTKKVFLMDFKEDQRLKQYQDPEYQTWKTYHVTGRWPGTFKEFVDASFPEVKS